MDAKYILLVLCLVLVTAVAIAGCTSSQSGQPITTTSGSSQPGTIQVKVDYSGKWSGALGAGGNVKTVDGTGPQTFDIQNPRYFVSVNAQKMDDSNRLLTVSILRNGNVVATENTNAAYGVAMTSVNI